MKGWFSYRYGLPNGKWARANPYSTMLKALRKPLFVPGQRTPAQAYLRENLARVNEVYRQRNGPNVKGGIDVRTAIAQELLDQESEEFKAELKARLAAEYKAALDKHKETSLGKPSDDPDDVTE